MQLRHWLWKAIRNRTSSTSRGVSDVLVIQAPKNCTSVWTRSGRVARAWIFITSGTSSPMSGA